MSGFDKKQKATVSVAVITSFITTFTGSALNLSIPVLNQEFAVSAAAIGWIVTGITTVSGVPSCKRFTEIDN